MGRRAGIAPCPQESRLSIGFLALDGFYVQHARFDHLVQNSADHHRLGVGVIREHGVAHIGSGGILDIVRGDIGANLIGADAGALRAFGFLGIIALGLVRALSGFLSPLLIIRAGSIEVERFMSLGRLGREGTQLYLDILGHAVLDNVGGNGKAVRLVRANHGSVREGAGQQFHDLIDSSHSVPFLHGFGLGFPSRIFVPLS